MPRVDFQLWDRVYILKLICTAQATYSSFVVLIYIYLIILQKWTISEDDRSDIMKFKWSVVVAGALDFGLGILLAFAANMNGLRCKLRILIWIISETFLIPVSIFLLMQLQKRLKTSNKYQTDTHYSRVNIAQVCFLLVQYIFIAYAIDFLVQGQRRVKSYDPTIRPKSVYAPTDPQITTTESRHIRMSQSLLFQPSSSKAISRNLERELSATSVELSQKETSDRGKDEDKKRLQKHESEIWKISENFLRDAKTEKFPTEISRKIYARQKDWMEDKRDWKDEDWIKEEKIEWLQCDDKEKQFAREQDREWTEDEKEWRRDENYWMRDDTEELNKERDNREFEDKFDWSELEGKKNEEKQSENAPKE